jgi:hypothetical protein
MAIAIESLLFLLGGVILTLVLVKAFGRSSADEARPRGSAQVRLERTMNPSDGVEETRLVLNAETILVASSAGVRLADYAAEVEQLEAIATHMASALGVTVELARLSGKNGRPVEEVVPVRRLPRNQQNGSAP